MRDGRSFRRRTRSRHPRVKITLSLKAKLSLQPVQEGVSRSDDHATRSFAGKASVLFILSRQKRPVALTFNRDFPTAAHRNLPFGTRVRVTNLAMINRSWSS